ncbi:hypothetical protein [Streptomyces sp. NPDC003077]|uniref:hypothetical protein n=1 Tax=Streptomyces sp. NPDC003077 TaxID=3154443 RepID=UPI0033ADAB87
MIVISDVEFDQAATMVPADILRYLRGHGWSAQRDYGRGQIWALPTPPGVSGPPYEVMVPLDRRPRDYANRVADLLETLAVVENRRPGEVLREMTLPPADWQYLRLLPQGPPGTALLVDLVPALVGLRDLMVAAAAAAAGASDPQSVQPAQKSQRVKDFVSTVRLDQTRPGSYVIAAQTPLAGPNGEVPVDAPAAEPFARQVSRRLYTGVRCAGQAARESLRRDSLVDFAQYAAEGVSANLCEALVRMAGEERNPYEFSFAWAPELRVNRDTPPLDFPRALLDPLQEGARDLRARLGRRGAFLRGTVVRLNRSRPHGPGEVTVLAAVEGEEHGRLRRYRMVLRQEDYSQAALAHDQGHEITVRGDVAMRGGQARVEPVTGFTVHRVKV